MTNDSQEIIIDTRPEEEYALLHYTGAFHFPSDTIRSLSCALPQRHHSITVVCGTPHNLEMMKEFFLRMGYVKEPTFLIFSAEASLLPLTSGLPDRSRRCWEPNRLLKENIDFIETSLCSGGFKGFVAFDIGCGTARDSLFLTQRGGWHCIGLDNRRKLLDQASNLYSFHGEASSQFLLCNLRNSFPVRLGALDLVVVSRFLHRQTLSAIFDLPRVGGFLLYSHFLDGCQHTVIGTPSTLDGFLLRDELADICSNRGDYEILFHEEARLDDGRPMVHFIAQRRQIIGTVPCCDEKHADDLGVSSA